MNARGAIGLIVGISVLHYAVMGYAGYDPSIEAETLMEWSLTLMFVWWVLEDGKKQKYHRPYEFGAFIFFAWPVVLPVYLVATRGLRGILIFPGFILLFYIPWITGWSAYYLNSSSQWK